MSVLVDYWCVRAEEKDVRKVLLGAVLMLVILLLSALAVMRLGLMPVNADGTHSSLEARIMPLVLHASIVRHASADTNRLAVNEENLKAGASIYKAMCARCHSTPGDNPSPYGQSFYPPAPQLPGGMPNYTDSQLFWTIKHGIRTTRDYVLSAKAINIGSGRLVRSNTFSFMPT